jgi:hypothetical protein
VDAVRVQVKRKGGLAGLTLAAELDTEDLGSEEAPRVEGALEQLLARDQSSGPPHPDGFEYQFELPDRGSVTVPEQELPEELQPLLDEFAKKGKMPGA